MTNSYRFVADDLTGGKEIPFQPVPQGECHRMELTRIPLNIPSPKLSRVEITKENLEAIETMDPEELDERVGILLATDRAAASDILPNYITLRTLLVQKQEGGSR